MLGRETFSLHLLSGVPLHRIAAIMFAVSFSAGVLQAQSDTLPPRLTGLFPNPTTVNVTNADQIVTFVMHVVDDLSGVDSTSESRLAVTLNSVSGNHVAFGLASMQPGLV